MIQDVRDMKTTFAERLREAMAARGVNANQLAILSKKAPSYFSTAFKRNTRTVTLDVAEPIADALGVRVAWLMSGDGPMDSDAAGSPSPAAPPVSDAYTTTTAADQVIAAAFDPTRHEYLDTVPVREALTSGAQLAKELDATEYTRRLLDTAARLRRKGQPVSGRDLHAATVQAAFEESRELRAQLAMRDQVLAEARDWLRANGFDLDDIQKGRVKSVRFTSDEPTTRPRSGSHSR